MTKMESFIKEEISRVRKLKLEGDILTPWGEGYNQGIENAANLIECIIRTALFSA